MNTFGYIAKAIGPKMSYTLLNNLKVQERQNRVWHDRGYWYRGSALCAAHRAPALLNEYRVPELNVQNGVLGAQFYVEYIGEMGRTRLCDTLTKTRSDRDLVHRQTACAAVNDMGVAGLGCEDALQHLMNV